MTFKQRASARGARARACAASPVRPGARLGRGSRAPEHTAADLHDGIGQVLAGQSMTLSAMRAHANQPKLAALIEEAVEASREAQEGLRLMIQDLSPPELEHASLEEMLKWLAELFKTRFGFTIAYRVSGGARARPRPSATRLSVRPGTVDERMQALRAAGCLGGGEGVQRGWVCVTVIDEGVGFDAQSELRRPPRAASDSLSCASGCARPEAASNLTSAAGGGCRVTVRLPV